MSNRWIRWTTVAAVMGVAAVAGWVSYEHALAVVRAHGETGAVAYAYPGTVDGLIYAASMVLLDAARRGVSAPSLARWMLAAGIGATLFANVWAGLGWGPLGAAVAAWPALALVGSYELLMLIVRAGSEPASSEANAGQEQTGANLVQSPIKDRLDAARVALNASIAAGYPRTANSLVTDFGLSRPEAKDLVESTRVASNGHANHEVPA